MVTLDTWYEGIVNDRIANDLDGDQFLLAVEVSPDGVIEVQGIYDFGCDWHAQHALTIEQMTVLRDELNVALSARPTSRQ
jgi:hypothetical protein